MHINLFSHRIKLGSEKMGGKAHHRNQKKTLKKRGNRKAQASHSNFSVMLALSLSVTSQEVVLNETGARILREKRTKETATNVWCEV